MRYDRYKQEKILIHTDEEHNKFWAACLNEQTNAVQVRWGRIGTKGQSQEKKFPHIHNAIAFMNTKFNEKKRKGYVDKIGSEAIDAPKLEQLAIEAAIVGTQNKCHSMRWVELLLDGSSNQPEFHTIDPDRLYEPDCTPGLLVGLDTKKAYFGEHRFYLLFTGDAAYLAEFHSPTGAGHTQINKSNPLYELTSKVEEAVGRRLA